MRRGLSVAVALAALQMMGCKKQVPNDIVQKSLTNALRHAPNTASAMCGTGVRGLASSTISAIKKGADNKGTAHIKGSPWFAKDAPSSCEGDVEFHYSYTSRTTGYKRKVTTTTWSLDDLKLTAVQTKGVTFKPVEEKPDDGDEDPPDGK